ncbi:Mu-like prophage FluMu protein gp28 [Cohaesibacter sp. ES.047]|uniref:hypothetical protein n=1 Tax=Cohaesibacter sp. ES.047 TaxID=1798205 RepID=UPI000BB6E2D6|nr:hypothetical protein [Cohaesibacter sp. ES.047]SNY91383.1 Mu-like prophage FluMu protein gp28 [Cohaesibacter sp. ES.047]
MLTEQQDPDRVAGNPVLARDDKNLSDDLPRGAEIPNDLDPFADGILMEHQKTWLEDDNDLKICEKGRRTGITFAEALDDTLIAAADVAAGGQNVFYIGDTKDKGREFIGYVAHFARTVQKEMVDIEDGVFFDIDENGNSRAIATYVIRFKSGFRAEALSSRPANIRGLQGVVVIDEAAFHNDVREVIDAVNALLIWGGKIRIISTHNGVLNAFNELIQEAKAERSKGKTNTWSIHKYAFADAIRNGLYKRVCMIKGKVWSQEAEDEWEAKIRGAYGSRKASMRQELDAIAAESEGQALSRVQIEHCMVKGIPVVRWEQPDNFRDKPDAYRKATVDAFCETQLLPHLQKLDPYLRHVLGQDFARKGDASCIDIKSINRDLTRQSRLGVELRNIPFEEQRDIVYFIVDRLPRFSGGAWDATGNGAYLAEKAAQKYGSNAVEVHFSQSWYKENTPAYIESFGSVRSNLLPADEDIVKDHQALAYVDGIIKVPQDFRFKGTDGHMRHGDYALASMLAYWVSFQDIAEYSYQSVSSLSAEGKLHSDDDDSPRGTIFGRSSVFGKMRGLW